jgi:RNA polymerase sigma-70 factor (ECF subfamily)
MLETVSTSQVLRAKAGDSSVIAELYERYHLSIFRYLYYKVGDPHTAEDLASEVFVRMIAALPGYQPNHIAFQAWLFQIARNLAIDHYRKAKLRDHLHLEDHLVAGEDDPVNTFEQGMTSTVLKKALTKLPDEQRDVIVMRFVSGMPISEVAQSLHKSENSIKGLQRRGLIALRDILTEWEVIYV